MSILAQMCLTLVVLDSSGTRPFSMALTKLIRRPLVGVTLPLAITESSRALASPPPAKVMIVWAVERRRSCSIGYVAPALQLALRCSSDVWPGLRNSS